MTVAPTPEESDVPPSPADPGNPAPEQPEAPDPTTPDEGAEPDSQF